MNPGWLKQHEQREGQRALKSKGDFFGTSDVILVFAFTPAMDWVEGEGAGCGFWPDAAGTVSEWPRGGARMHRLCLVCGSGLGAGSLRQA